VPPPGALPQVTVTRTGGLAGMSDKYVVSPDGSITAQIRRSPSPDPKKLTADERRQLRELVAAPALRAEAASGALTHRTCADGFVYTVLTGGLTVSGMDCGTLAKDAPTMWKIVQLVEAAAHRA
jgi:hypothetical protein